MAVEKNHIYVCMNMYICNYMFMSTENRYRNNRDADLDRHNHAFKLTCATGNEGKIKARRPRRVFLLLAQEAQLPIWQFSKIRGPDTNPK